MSTPEIIFWATLKSGWIPALAIGVIWLYTKTSGNKAGEHRKGKS